MKQINKKDILIFIITISICWIFSEYISNYEYFVWRKEIDIFSVISLLITSSIGIYIAVYLNKSIEASKFEKELIIEEVKKIKPIILEIKQGLLDNKLEFNTTINNFKKMGSRLSEIDQLNKILSFNLNVDDIIEDYRILKRNITGISPLVTGEDKLKYIEFGDEIKRSDSISLIDKIGENLIRLASTAYRS
ncbi:hypothetical protein KMW28_22310 [Flammeovirga yaeyamensis]|uniref:Uncharacterized protein n=1 Tax=Flammeovirga yaeyamensis TaxID=367791 RepID=A0AAX1NC46_9BACT|nr:hypothetical protein [Flammeovirga yaeyamensis]MBB3696907.1 hypothetical protein [Flammeovirga yaeyamensis]NMF33571.1 hypothetical protein [Flammeovirga yaeyamensis]QWG05160.1 hypothetical protein KMW28_22310 [Flammeovirga yaeyamensis]